MTFILTIYKDYITLYYQEVRMKITRYPKRKPKSLNTIKASFIFTCLAKDITKSLKEAWELACKGE